jgi:hypothetical protein
MAGEMVAGVFAAVWHSIFMNNHKINEIVHFD